MSATPDWAGEPEPCAECGRRIDYDYARELHVHLDGRPCGLHNHEAAGHYVTVWVAGSASQEDAERVVGDVLAQAGLGNGLTADVVPE